jgi:peptidoglycan LD-endopeptidase LytH
MIYGIAIFMICNISSSVKASSEEKLKKAEEQQTRMSYYFHYQEMMAPWYYLAAVDQYERNIQDVRTDIPKRESVIAIQFSDEYWVGPFNPKKDDNVPLSIKFFGGNGMDGDGDGLADKNNDDDVLFTMAKYLSVYGNSEEDVKLALWDYYRNEQTVNQIMVIAKLYKKFETIDIDTHTFPVAVEYRYSYGDTWGANRGWGGRRSHEGTDIYAGYGTPVLSASYGVIEEIGWNDYGGWRIGIRDNHNSYHYYAHLDSFEKGLKDGDIVKTGQVIGYVGSTGYGKKGTAGKFPPHLHYGIYKFNGSTEWAFNPYPSLVQWEKEAKNKK